jgi:CRP-like cAMP-binding protein
MITERFFHDGTIIFEEDSQATEAFIIKSGAIEVSKLFDTKRVVLATIGPGQVVGELGVLRSHSKRTAQGRAKGRTEVLAIEQAYFDQMLENLDAVGRQILLALAARVEHTTQMKNFDRYDNPLRSYHTLIAALCAGKETDEGVDIEAASRSFRRVLGVQRLELREVLQRMERVKLIELIPSSSNPQTIKLTKHDNVDKVINQVTEDLGTDYFDFNLSSRDMMEFDLIAEEQGVTSDELWKAMVAGKVPREAIFLGRSIVEKADLSAPSPDAPKRGRGEGREKERGGERDPRGDR